jgi:hypothetical protein
MPPKPAPAADPPEAPEPPPAGPPTAAEVHGLWRVIDVFTSAFEHQQGLNERQAGLNLSLLVIVSGLLAVLLIQDKEIQALTKAVKALQG